MTIFLAMSSSPTVEISIFRLSEDEVQEESGHLRAQGIRGEVDQCLEGGIRAD